MSNKLKIMKALALLSQVGIAIILPIIGGLWLGHQLDQLLEISGLFLIIGTLLGVVVGFRSAYRLLISQQDEPDRK